MACVEGDHRLAPPFWFGTVKAANPQFSADGVSNAGARGINPAKIFREQPFTSHLRMADSQGNLPN
jgi:hypothetical protein